MKKNGWDKHLEALRAKMDVTSKEEMSQVPFVTDSQGNVINVNKLECR